MSSILPPLLAGLNLPDDIQRLSLAQKQDLAAEVRETMIRVVSMTGGHLAPSLGVVELTIALLSTFSPAQDHILWDVGHQSYPWKILTGRAEVFHTLRQFGGISGFPRREESAYDSFGVGHASTSLSAALGIAAARDLRGGKEHVLAVIGDGALTGGMAFEALNQAGGMGKKLTVILNDNTMSISKSVGALSLFLSRNLAKSGIMTFKLGTAEVLSKIPKIGKPLVALLRRGEVSFKTFFTLGKLFEVFGFNYIGPINGHDIAQLQMHLETSKKLDMPVLLHVRTQKGKGYQPAEKDPSRFHGVPSFEPETGLVSPTPPSADQIGPGFSQAFGEALCELAETNPKIVAITAAMPSGTGLDLFQKRFPARFFDVGICEEHAVTFAAGLATRGLQPVVPIYSTFMQRAFDQIIHDVCLQRLPVVLCLDRAGLVGEDGPTHHGAFDLAWLRVIPNLDILAPRDERELRDALYTGLTLNRPVAIRYPRGRSLAIPSGGENPLADLRGFNLLAPATGEMLITGDWPVCILNAGHRAFCCVEAARLVEAKTGKLASVFDSRWIKPLPEAQILALAKTHSAFLIVEENSRQGGFSSAVLELFADHNLPRNLKITRIGLPDRFIPHGSIDKLRSVLGFDSEGIAARLEELFEADAGKEGSASV